MESISENTDKNNESGDPNDSVEKLNTEIVENVIQPECSHPAEKLEEINTSSASSNNKTIEDIDIDDIVLLTESLPVIEDCVENNKNIDSNTVNKESEEQAVNQSENVNIDSIQLIEATENETAPEKCDDEPMDIDEILNSLGVDFDVPSSSEASSSQTVTENTVETSNIEKQTGKEEEEVVLLTDDEENGKFNFTLLDIIFCEIYTKIHIFFVQKTSQKMKNPHRNVILNWRKQMKLRKLQTLTWKS